MQARAGAAAFHVKRKIRAKNVRKGTPPGPALGGCNKVFELEKEFTSNFRLGSEGVCLVKNARSERATGGGYL